MISSIPCRFFFWPTLRLLMSCLYFAYLSSAHFMSTFFSGTLIRFELFALGLLTLPLRYFGFLPVPVPPSSSPPPPPRPASHARCSPDGASRLLAGTGLSSSAAVSPQCPLYWPSVPREVVIRVLTGPGPLITGASSQRHSTWS